MPFTTGQESKLIAPGLRAVMFQAYNDQPTEYTKIFNTKTSKRAYEEDLEFVGIEGPMPEKPEGTGIIYREPKQGEVKRYTHTAFGLGFRVTKEAMDDDLYGIISGKGGKMAKEIGKAGRLVREVRAAAIFNGGFVNTGGFPKNGTAEVLFGSHTLIGTGGTYSNTASADLAQTPLENAIINFNKLTDEMGHPIVVIPKQLLVPPDLIMVARVLLGSEFSPYTANNDINPSKADRLSLEINHYLTDADSWFMLADKSDHNLQFLTRTDMAFDYSDDFDTGDMKMKGFQRFSVGYGDWRGVYGGLGV